ncbi:MAG: tetratricopeptide repeat protein [Opitutaceae bacterium]|nr:tetratricopeptide repeat protein [Opitutaceae bacterium]
MKSVILSCGILVFALVMASRADFIADAEKLAQEGKLTEAKAMLEQALAAEPANAKLHHALGVLSAVEGNLDLALQQLAHARALEPKDANIIRDLAGVHFTLAQKNKSIREAIKGKDLLKEAVEAEPKNVTCRRALVGFYRDAPFFVGGSKGKAYDEIESLRKLDPKNASYMALEAYIDDERWQDAEREWEAVRALAPQENYWMILRGKLCARSGKGLEAGEAMLTEYLKIEPLNEWERGNALLFLGEIRRHKKDYAGARKLLEEAKGYRYSKPEAEQVLAKLPAA